MAHHEIPCRSEGCGYVFKVSHEADKGWKVCPECLSVYGFVPRGRKYSFVLAGKFKDRKSYDKALGKAIGRAKKYAET